MQRMHVIRKLTDAADLVGEPLPSLPVIEIAGDNRVLIECHEGMLKYDEKEIHVRVVYGVISISGSYLEVMKMTKEQLVISGKIDSVSLQRRQW